jgi:hypothetical protein
MGDISTPSEARGVAEEFCDYETDFKGAGVHSWLPYAATNSHSGL